MRKLKIALLIILGFIGFLFLGLIGLIWYSYKIAPDPREKESQIRTQYKSIRIENKLDSMSFYINIKFKYTQQDSLIYCKTKMDDSINSYINLDSAILFCSPHYKELLTIPILNSDSVQFPKSFYIKIYNKDTSKLLKGLDFNSFMEHAIPEYIANKENLLTAQQWTLVIDSTLLDLKK